MIGQLFKQIFFNRHGRNRAGLAPFLMAATLFFIQAVSSAEEVPLASCEATPAYCPHVAPYYGPTPANWEEAAKLACVRYAAAHYGSGTCPCDGRICSTVTACALVSKVQPDMVGANWVTGRFTMDAVNNNNGSPWGTSYGIASPWGGPTCSCPLNATFTANGTCVCDAGFAYDTDERQCRPIVLVSSGPNAPGATKDNGESCPSCGNPINPGNGNKVQRESDYVANSAGDLSLTRTYNGNPFSADRNVVRSFGMRWTQSYDRFLKQEPNQQRQTCYRRIGDRVDDNKILCRAEPVANTPEAVSIIRPDGKKYWFNKSGTTWINDADVNDRVIANYDTNGTTLLGWTYVTTQDETERYSVDGKLLSITGRNGSVQQLTYSDGVTNDTSGGRVPAEAPTCSRIHPGAVLPAGRLLCVTDHNGRQLHFEYDEKGRIVKAVDPANQEYRYAYDGLSGGCTAAGSTSRECTANNLTQVTYPDSKSKIYYYNEAPQINNGLACPNVPAIGNGFGSLPNVLTGITDENGVRYASWTYDCQGRATSSHHADGTEKVLLSYGPLNANGGTTTTVTSYVGELAYPQTTARSYSYQMMFGVAKNTGISGPCAGCGSTAAMTYDANGNVASRTDFNGNVTTYNYDLTRNLEISRTEGVGTAQARTITTEWHPTYRLPVRIAEPLRLTINHYDPKGNLLSKTIQATADATGAQRFAAAVTGTARTWRYTYNDVGQVLTAIGPRTDIDDTTRYDYDAATGNLLTITNAAGHVTTLTDYDANGRVGKIINANGLTTDLRYTPRGWLKSRTVTGNGTTELTTYDYDGVGQLKKVTMPDGSWIGYDYDDAHRLTDTYDSLGNRITYTLDAMGNRLKEEVKDPVGVLAKQVSRVYDALNRLKEVTGAAQ